MTAPVLVTVVRPASKVSSTVGRLIGHYAGCLFDGWIVMFLVPAVIDRHPGYWQSVAAVLLLAFLLPSESAWTLWTKASK